MKAIRPGNWTPHDDEIVRQAIRDGLTSRQCQETLFPYRTTESLKRRMQQLRAAMGITITTNFSKSKHSPGPPKPMQLEPLKYDLSECPRVTFQEACEWMRAQKKHWRPTGDRKTDWLTINAVRLYGPVPVPPMLPRHGVER